ncbi:ABC transporter substrate-binding protein [Streptomyces sp. NPDC057486]|uniref:ABC transporter substrate-binding protein n=1 Tax=Streptomyces sp. NPDC057486 TaxID=3346145 RepID=UPI0036B37C71
MRAATSLGLAATAGGLLTGCSDGNADVPGKQPPSYYPTAYDKIIEASRRERKLLIYSQTSQTIWQAIFDAFSARYPWVGDVRATNFSSSAVYERYYSEAAAGTSPADLLVSSTPGNWADYAKRNIAAHYTSAEKEKLAAPGEILPGVWAFSLDPVVVLYNRKTVRESEYPTGIQSLADIAEARPSRFRGKIGTTNPSNSYGFGVNYTYTDGVRDGWRTFNRVLPFAHIEHSSGTLVEKVASGEYDYAINISGATARSLANGSGGLLAWSYYDEGTVTVPRAASIVKTAPHPATARLFLDFLLSEDGQLAAGEGGLTPYRPGIRGDGYDTFQDIQRKLGDDQVHLCSYQYVSEQAQAAYVQRWEKAQH